MAIFPRPASPRALMADIKALAAQRSRVHWVGVALAVSMPLLLLWGFSHDVREAQTPPTTIIFAESWRADRSDAEIKTAQKERQIAKEKADREKQEAFKRLEKRFGL